MASNRRGRDTRRRILDAGEALLASRGTALTMEEVAAAAGVTRVTVYRHVRDREDLITAVVLRSSARLAERLAATLDATDRPFAERLADAVVLVVTEVRRTPHLAALVQAGNPGHQWPEIDRSGRFLTAVHDFFRPRLERAVADEGVVLRAELDVALDWLLRQALLLMLITGAHGDDGPTLRREVETFVVPSVLAPRPG